MKPVLFCAEPKTRIEVSRMGDSYLAVAKVTTPSGELCLTAKVSAARILRALGKLHAVASRADAAAHPGIVAGAVAFAKNPAQAVHAAAKQTAVRSVLARVDQVARDPHIAKNTGLAAAMYPRRDVPPATVKLATAAYDSARALLRRARHGDTQAKAQIRAAIAKAKTGDADAVKLCKILAVVERYCQAVHCDGVDHIAGALGAPRVVPLPSDAEGKRIRANVQADLGRQGHVTADVTTPAGKHHAVDLSWRAAGIGSLGGYALAL